MDWGSSDEIERVLMTEREVNVFQIPPAASSRGHRAEDWRGKQIWKGKVRILAKGDT